jgi:DNA-binding Lrp family transcriptional regulator
MSYKISNFEKLILSVIQEGFPGSKTPYKEMAAKAGIETKQLLEILQQWKHQGKLRRVGAIVNHFKVGLSGGAMVAWQVEPEDVEMVGKILAEFKEVSHAYERRTGQNWPYNVYTMIHGSDVHNIEQIVNRMSQACGISNYRILQTEKELKKVPPTYIKESTTKSNQDA